MLSHRFGPAGGIVHCTVARALQFASRRSPTFAAGSLTPGANETV